MNTSISEEISEQAHHISSTGIFSGLSETSLKNLESMGVYMNYEQEMVTASGQELEYFFFIIKGKFEVSRVDPQNGNKIILATIGEGECFGEMSFFTGASASANVIAAGKVICWAIPHASLREFIENHDGGARLAISIGALLANRVQEGNARLMGLNATLSAYFGHQARRKSKGGAPIPRSNQSAEMEIPDEVFDDFVRDTLNIEDSQDLTESHRQQIRAKLDANQLDIIPWLEREDRGKNLKMRLKLVEEKPSRLKPSLRRPSSTLMQPTLIKIPQIRSEPIPQPSPSKAGTAKLVLNLISYILLPILGSAVIILLLPLESRESLVRSPQFQKTPFHSILANLLIRNTTQIDKWTLQQGAIQTLRMSFPKEVLLRGNIRLDQPSPYPFKLKIKVLKTEGNTPIFNQTLDIPVQENSLQLFMIKLEPGSYILECACEDWPTGTEIPSQIFINAKS